MYGVCVRGDHLYNNVVHMCDAARETQKKGCVLQKSLFKVKLGAKSHKILVYKGGLNSSEGKSDNRVCFENLWSCICTTLIFEWSPRVPVCVWALYVCVHRDTALDALIYISMVRVCV